MVWQLAAIFCAVLVLLGVAYAAKLKRKRNPYKGRILKTSDGKCFVIEEVDDGVNIKVRKL